MKTVWVLFGNAGFGKDTLADFMLKRIPNGKKIGFADPIKLTAMSMLGIPHDIAFGSSHIKDTTMVYGQSVRHWLRWIGEMGRKQVNPLVWVHRFCDEVIRHDGDVICPDARHWNELEEPKLYFSRTLPSGIAVRNVSVNRPNHPLNLTHASETEVQEMFKETDKLFKEGKKPLFDAAINNGGTIETLGRLAESLLDAKFD